MSEVQVTDQDNLAAEKIVYNATDVDGVITHTVAIENAIALALAQAREAGYKAALADLTKSDTPIDVSPLRWVNGKRSAPKGNILDDDGHVRLILTRSVGPVLHETRNWVHVLRVMATTDEANTAATALSRRIREGGGK
jgi:hypothetical protein